MVENGRPDTRHAAWVPLAASIDPGLPPESLRVLVWICGHADKERRCYPSLRKAARMLGLTRSGVQYHIRKIKGRGYLSAMKRKRPDGADSTNEYLIVYPPLSCYPPASAVLAPPGKSGTGPEGKRSIGPHT